MAPDDAGRGHRVVSPARRTRAAEADGELPVLGYVGRLSVEKNGALLPRVDAALRERGLAVRRVIVGHGAEEDRLRRAFGGEAVFTGALRGAALASAYADMDLFVFPSLTDTFGNVVLEALASGMPTVETPEGGTAYTVRDGVTGGVVP